MLKARLVIFFFLFTGVASAQVDLSTPRKTYNTFHNNLQAGNSHDASKVIYSRHVLSRSRRISLVEDLKLYFEKNNISIVPDSIPDKKNYKDPGTGKNIFYLSKEISLERYGKNWYISKESTDKIPSLVAGESEPRKKAPLLGGKLDAERQAREAELAEIARMPVDLSSPYATLSFYLENIDVDPAIAARIVANDKVPHLEQRIDIVTKLGRFLRGKGVVINLDHVPDTNDFTDSLKAGRYTYQITYRFSDIYLERYGNNWYLSEESAEKIPHLYESAFPFGSDRLLQYLPTEGRREFMGLVAWQYFAILLIIILTYFIYRFLKWSITFLVTKVMFRFGYRDIAMRYVQPVVSPIGLLLAFMLADASTPLLQLPIKLTAFVSITVSMLIPLYATIAIYRSMDILGLYMEKLAGKTETTFDDQLVPLIRKILKIFVAIIGGVYVLESLNVVDMKVLFGTLSVGGLALALAAQDTIKNFFGSVMIFLDKPFHAGHWIVTKDGIDGTVEQVGLRSTRIRTFENSMITVPNGKLSDVAINNYGMRAYRRFKTHISVTYDTPPDVLELFIEGLRKIVLEHPHTRKDYYHVYMNDMGSHSLNILFYIFFITPNWGEELQYRHEIIISIMKLADELGINFAFPTQTLHMENFPGQPSLSPDYEPADKLEAKLNKFFGEKKDPGKPATGK